MIEGQQVYGNYVITKNTPKLGDKVITNRNDVGILSEAKNKSFLYLKTSRTTASGIENTTHKLHKDTLLFKVVKRYRTRKVIRERNEL
jgi:hypothetical protein